MRIFLLGYMGCGKSTLGKQLAEKLKLNFKDLDTYIEEINKTSITNFFNKYGELIFRKEERHRLTELCLLDDIVISVGGGTPCFMNNMQLMNHYGKTLFIAPPLEHIIQRLQNRTSHRPLLANKTDEQLRAFVEKSYAERLPFYQKSNYKIQAPNIRIDDLLPFF